MKIGVVSDTHSHKLPEQMVEAFKDVDLIIHAGDLCTLEDYNALSKINKIEAVYGNMDGQEIHDVLSRMKIIKCEKASVGIYHGRGAPEQLLECVKEEFRNKKVDVVVFGHSHHPFNEILNGVLYFNPGSPNDTVFAPYCSFGMLDVNDGKVKGKIIEVENNG